MVLLQPAKYGYQFLLGNGMKVEIERVGAAITIRATSKEDSLGSQICTTVAVLADQLNLTIDPPVDAK